MRLLPRVLRHRSFRLLWTSQLISQMGDRLTLVVLALAVTEMTGDATAVGLVLAARFAPMVVLIPFGGVWADRLPRRAVMMVADIARFALHAALAVLFLAGAVEVWHIVVIEALFAAAEAFAIPAYQGLIPQTVDEDQLQEATALASLTRNVALLAGPALGTGIYVAAGAGWAFLVDALSFALAALLLAFVRARPRGDTVVRTGVLRELRDGFHEVRSRTWLWVTVLVANLWLLTSEGPFTVLGPALADDIHGDVAKYGVSLSVFGGGLVVGAFVAGRVRPARPLVVGLACITSLPLFYLVFASGVPFWAVLAAAAVAGVCTAVFDVLWLTTMVREIPPEALSRAFSFDYMGSFATMPVGFLMAGALAEAFGAKPVVYAGVVIWLLATAAALAVPGVRNLRGPVSAPDRAAASRSSVVPPDPLEPGAPR